MLPFVNMSGDPEQAYFADGISADIISELGRFGELLVTAASSSFSFRDQTIDAREIAEKLEVAYLVEGSVRRAGERVRITAQLIEAESGNRVWGERYDRDLADIFAVQDEIAGNVAMAAIGGVRRQGANRARRVPTDHLGAYDHWLRAREMQNRYERFADAIPFLEKAIEIDPHYALAYATLSTCLLIKSFYSQNEGAAQIAALRAPALDAATSDVFGRPGEETFTCSL